MHYPASLQNLNVLIISANAGLSRNWEDNLSGVVDLVDRFWHCRSLRVAPEMIEGLSSQLDIILLDFAMIEPMNSVQSLQLLLPAAAETPVLIGNCPHDMLLMTTLIQAGAADCLSAMQIEQDQSRLRQSVAKAIVRRARQDTAFTQPPTGGSVVRLQELRRANAELRERQHLLAERYATRLQQHEEKLREQEEVISWLTGGYSVRN